LVRAQLHVAAGGALPWSQTDLTQRGHAIECRVYAEDPGAGFLPQAGPLLVYREPSGPGIRVDGGVEQGSNVPGHYDPMLAKLVASGESRQAAIARAAAALASFPVLGVRTNIAFLGNVLRHPAFAAGDLHTGFIDDHLDELLRTPEPSETVMAAVAFARENGLGAAAAPAVPTTADPWGDRGGGGGGGCGNPGM